MTERPRAETTANKIARAYVLAGGQSRRMGQDKLFVRVDGKPLLERTLAVCLREFRTVSILAREREKFVNLGFPVVLDYPGARGPLAGIISALEDCPDSACFITAADLLDLNSELINRLLSEFSGEDYLGIDEGVQRQPLCGIYSTSALPVLRRQAERGALDLQSALRQLDVRCLAAPQANWRNINSEQDLNAGSLK